MIPGLSPRDAQTISDFAERRGLTVEEAERAFIEIAINEILHDSEMWMKLNRHGDAIKAARENPEPYPEPKSRW